MSEIALIEIELDAEIAKGLCRLKAFGFPISTMISESLKSFIDTFLPFVDLYEQGKLTADDLPEFMKGIESLIIKTEVAKVRLDKELKTIEKQKKIELRVKSER